MTADACVGERRSEMLPLRLSGRTGLDGHYEHKNDVP